MVNFLGQGKIINFLLHSETFTDSTRDSTDHRRRSIEITLESMAEKCPLTIHRVTTSYVCRLFP